MGGDASKHEGKLDHLLQLAMMVLFWHISIVAIVAWGVGHVEQDILSNVTTALRESGFRNVGVTVEGREVLLSGEVPGPVERQRVVAVAAMVPGTRLVDVSRMRIAAPSPQLAATPSSDGPSHLETLAMDQIHSLLQSDVRFAGPTSSRLTDRSQLALAQVATLLVDHPEIRGVIEARTSAEVSAQSPGLAERRANVVVSYLLGSGIETNRVQAAGEEGGASADDPDSLGFVPAPSMRVPSSPAETP